MKHPLVDGKTVAFGATGRCRRLARLLALAAMAACAGPTHPGGNTDAQNIVPCDAASAATKLAGPGCGLVCRAELPLDLSETVPRVTVWLNGRAASMGLDTGASGTSVTPPAATRLGLTVDPTPVGSAWGIGGTQQVNSTGPVTFAFGHVTHTAKRIAVAVTHDQAESGAADGTIGTDLISQFETDLDLPHAVVRFYAGRPCDGTLPGWTQAAASLPMSRPLKGRQPAIPVTLDGVAMTALLDSGAADSLVNTDAARRLGSSDQELALEMKQTLVGFGAGSTPARLRRFKSLLVGNEMTGHPDLTVADMPFKVPEMTLGTPFMATHKVWLSYATGRVYISSTW